MVLAAHLAGRPTRFAAAEAELADAGALVDMATLRRAIEAKGLCARAGRISKREVPPVPAIIPVTTGRESPLHYIVVYGSVDGWIQKIDFPSPPKWVRAQELARIWDGTALLVAARPETLDDLDIYGNRRHGLWLVGVGVVLLFAAIVVWRRTVNAQTSVIAAPRSGVTLIELLVVIGITAILASLLMPAVQRARAAAARQECASHLKQLGIALHAYAGSYRFFPSPIGHWVLLAGKASERDYSAHTQLLPFLEQNDAFNSINFDGPAWSTENSTARTWRVSVFLCPADGFRFPDSNVAPNSYRANLGTGPIDTPVPQIGESGDGAFCLVPLCLSPSDFVDGLEWTAAVSEKQRGDGDDLRFTPETDSFVMPAIPSLAREDYRSACALLSHQSTGHFSSSGYSWFRAGPHDTWYNHIEPPNTVQPDCADKSTHPDSGIFSARSLHPGGVNVMFASGSVRFISQTIDLSVWRAIGSRNGNELVDTAGF
jgi:prepilin-type N-terminal cleavage/methylation domain-containing protein